MRSDMGDELDVDAMLEAPFTKEDQRSSADVEEERKENGHGETSKEERPKDNGEKSSPAKEDRGSGRDRERSGRDRDRDKRRDRHSRSRSRDRRQNRSRSRDRRGDRRRSRSRGRGDRDRERRDLGDRRDRRRRSRSGSRERRRRSPSGSREKRRRTRSKSRERRRRTRSRSRDRRRRSRSHSKEKNKSKSKTPKRELTAEERDARTVFCMQLSSRIKARDLEDFFSVVGKISDVRIITDAKTRRSKGIAYVEFEDVESVPLALGLSGQKVLGVPIIVQLTMAEKNRAANVEAMTIRGNMGPMRLYVGSLHFNITEDMLRSIFEPFGRIESIQLINDTETGRSKGYGFVTFQNAEDAKKALEQLNGFELAGRAMKVNHVTERADGLPGIIENDDMERSGFDSAAAANPNKINQSFVFLSGATGRLQLMAKLAEGTGMELPQAATNHLNMPTPQVPQQQLAPPIATQCFLLSNMFDPSAENNPNWAKDISDDVIEECNKHGGVFHVFVDRQSAQGNVYVKCPSIATAVAAVNALHGRYFAGKMITAAYVPVLSYHSLFPDAMTTTKLL